MVNCENDEVIRSRSTYDALNERETPSDREVRIGVRDAVHLAVLAAVEIDRQAIAGAEQIAVDVVAAGA